MDWGVPSGIAETGTGIGAVAIVVVEVTDIAVDGVSKESAEAEDEIIEIELHVLDKEQGDTVGAVDGDESALVFAPVNA